MSVTVMLLRSRLDAGPLGPRSVASRDTRLAVTPLMARAYASRLRRLRVGREVTDDRVGVERLVGDGDAVLGQRVGHRVEHRRWRADRTALADALVATD